MEYQNSKTDGSEEIPKLLLIGMAEIEGSCKNTTDLVEQILPNGSGWLLITSTKITICIGQIICISFVPLGFRKLVGSMGAITPRTSQLDLDVPVSVHPAPDNLYTISDMGIIASCVCSDDNYDERLLGFPYPNYYDCRPHGVVRLFHRL